MEYTVNEIFTAFIVLSAFIMFVSNVVKSVISLKKTIKEESPTNEIRKELNDVKASVTALENRLEKDYKHLQEHDDELRFVKRDIINMERERSQDTALILQSLSGILDNLTGKNNNQELEQLSNNIKGCVFNKIKTSKDEAINND